jgi:hypothetical protein
MIIEEDEINPEPIKLPSPDEVFAERQAVLDVAAQKLIDLGLTIEEAKAVIGIG